MSNDKQKSWYYTLPGILSGIAALITALTGVLLAMDNLGWLDTEEIVKESLPNSTPFFMIRLVNEKDIKNKDYYELDIMRNEIYARHGRRFKRIDLQRHFDQQEWYIPQYQPEEFPKELLTPIQYANVIFIAEHQSKIKYLNR
jgi:hypothetical protein